MRVIRKKSGEKVKKIGMEVGEVEVGINKGKEKAEKIGVDVCAGVVFWSRMRGSPLWTDRMRSGNA